MELFARDDPEVAALDREEAAIRQAELAYRGDAALAADFEQSGWFPERTEAAKRGEAIPSEGRRQHDPVLQLPSQPGQVQFRPSPWAGFVSLLAEVNARRVELLERRRPQILDLIAEQEAQLRGRVLDTKVRDLGGLVEEADELLRLAITARGPVPGTIATNSGLAPARFREHTDELELVDASTGGWSLLDPVPADEPTSLVAAGYGIQPDTSGPADRRPRQDQALRFGTSRG